MRRLLIAGRRGGLGRTTAAVNLAAAAARAGTAVLLVDAEPSLAAVAALSLDPQSGQSDHETHVGTRWWREPRLQLDVVAVPVGMSLINFLRDLDSEPLRSRYQWAIVDAPLGSSAASFDALLWMASGDLSAAKSVPADLARVGANGRANVLLLMPARSIVDVRAEFELRSACGPDLRVASLPFDAAVGRSLLMGRPVVDAHPEAPASAAFRALAVQLGLVPEPATPDWPAVEPVAIPDYIVASVPDDIATTPSVAAPGDLEVLVADVQPPPLPAVNAATGEAHAPVDSYMPDALPVEELTRPADSDFIDLPEPPVDEPPSGITAHPESIVSAEPAPVESMAMESSGPVPEMGFHVEFDALADGSAWTTPVADIPDVTGAGFAVISDDDVIGPPVPLPVEVPFGVDRGSDTGLASHRALNESSMPFIAHGIELNAPKAAIHGPACNEDESAKFWGPTEAQQKPETVAIDGHTGDISAVAFSPDGRQVLTTSWDKTVRVWWAKDGAAITTLKGHSGVVSSLAFSPDGDTLVTGSWDKTVRLWDAITYTELKCLSGHTGVVMTVAASVDGRSFASGGWDKTVRLWDTDIGECKALAGHTRMVTGVAFSQDGTLLASASWDKSIRVWDAVTGDAIRTLSGHVGDVTGIAWLSNDRLVSVAQDHTAMIWDVARGEIVQVLKGHSGEVNVVAASADGSMIATAGWDKSVRLWDAADGSARMVLTGHSGVVSGLSFDSDGTRIASVGLDRALRLWDVTTHRQIAAFTIQSADGIAPTEVLLPDQSDDDLPRPVTQEADERDDIFSNDGPTDEPPPPSGIMPASAPTKLRMKVPALRQGGALHALAVASGGGLIAAGAADGLIMLWESGTGADAGVLRGASGTIAALAFAPGGRMLAAGGEDGVVRLWDVASARERLSLPGHEAAITAVAINPEGSILVSSDIGGDIKIWDLAVGREIHSVHQRGGTLCLAFAPDGEKLAAGGRNGSINVWNIVTLEQLTAQHGHDRGVNALAFTTDGRTLATGGHDGIVRFWEVANWNEWNNLDAHSEAITAVAFSANGKLLVTASEDESARLWDCVSGQLVHELKGHSEPIVAAAFAPDNFTVCTASHDQTVRSWYTETGEQHGLMCQTSDSVTGDGTGVDFGIGGVEARVAPSTRFRLAAGASDGRIRLWDVGESQRISEYPAAVWEGHELDVNGLAFTPDGTLLASASGDMSVRLWNVRRGQSIAKLEGHTGEVSAAAFSPDGTSLATGSWDTLIRMWDVNAKSPTGTLRGHVGAVTAVAFHPAGRLLASAGWDKNVILWDLAGKKAFGTLTGHEKMVTAVTFAPDGKTVVTGGWDKTARLWNPDTSRCLRTFTGHRFAVSAVAVHPDGKTLATGSWDTAVKLWDLDTGKEIRTLYGHTESIRSVAFTPDGSLIASGSWDGTVRVWDPATGEERAVIKLPGSKFHAVAFIDVRKKK